jgi:hypothetical protein
MSLTVILLFWIPLAFVAGWIAQDKGREPLGFVLLSLFLTPIIGIIAALGAQARVRPGALPVSSIPDTPRSDPLPRITLDGPRVEPKLGLENHPWGIK